MSSDYNHHGVMFSYYSAKTRAYMSYKRIPFTETFDPANTHRYQAATGKGMIPVVETPDGEILQDTTVIIDILEQRFPERPVMPEDPLLLLITRIVEFILDEMWIVTSMHSRWNDPVSKQFVMSEMSRVIGGSAGLEGDEAAKVGNAVAGKMQSYLPMLGVADPARHDQVDQFFQATSTALNNAVGHQRFAFGTRPTLIDFCLFTAYYAHQYRDEGSAQTFLKTQTPDLAYFLDTLHAGNCANASGALSLTEPFIAYLSILGPAGATFADGVMRATRVLADESTPGPLEKPVGMVDFEMNGPFTRGGSTFSAWKLQRATDLYPAAQSEEADALLARIGWLNVVKAEPGYRLEREDHKVHLSG